MTDKEIVKYVYLAMLSNQCSRHEDMIKYLNKLVKVKTEDLSDSEKMLLSTGYKEIVNKFRHTLNILNSYEFKHRKKQGLPYLGYIREYKKEIQKKLEEKCLSIIKIIDEYLIPKGITRNAEIFYYKLKGDYYRYLAENVEKDKTNTRYSELCNSSYHAALHYSKHIDYKNPFKLSLGLHLVMYYYNIVSDRNHACLLAQEILIKAKEAFDSARELTVKDKKGRDIFYLLEEYYEMWKNEEKEEEK